MQLIKHVHIFAPQDLGIQDILISEGHIAHIAPHIETAPYMEITDGSGKQLTPRYLQNRWSGGIADEDHITGKHHPTRYRRTTLRNGCG